MIRFRLLKYWIGEDRDVTEVGSALPKRGEDIV